VGIANFGRFGSSKIGERKSTWSEYGDCVGMINDEKKKKAVRGTAARGTVEEGES
jgi:hypothetical protein